MTGKTVLVTGATDGIGRATATRLAALGARVGITGRDRARTEQAAVEISAAGGGAAVEAFGGDLSSLAEVRRLADEVLRAFPRLDVLVNNVGGFWAHRHVTADGYERTFALNHLAPFLLTNLLLKRLLSTGNARIVNVSSSAHTLGRIDFEDLMQADRYSGQRAYNQSKLANVMFTNELARRLDGSGVTANALHPGMTSTAFGAEDVARGWRPIIALTRTFLQSPDRGADTAVHLASSRDVAGVSGKYFAGCRVRQAHPSSREAASIARLWDVSARLVELPVSALTRS